VGPLPYSRSRMSGNDFTSVAIRRVPCHVTAVTIVLFTCALRSFASDPQMKIDDVRFDNGAIVKFLSIGSDHVVVNADALKKMIAGQTDNGRYTVFADVESITAYPSFENYDFYVRSASASVGAPLTRFTFQATPYDTFPDQDKPLQIHLLDGVQDQTVQLSIPVHSLKSGTSLSAQLNAIVKVHLSGDTVSIDVQNKYLLPVTITGARVEEVPLSHWIAQPVLTSSVPLTLGPDESSSRATLTWKVQPRAWGVLRDSVWPFSASPSARGAGQNNEAFEKLEFSIDYIAAQGGFPHTLKVSRDVNFYPSLPALVGVASLGALAGGLVMFFGIRKDSGSRKFAKYLWPNIVLAVIIELIAIALFSFDNSRVQIGTLNLNPTLLIPAACLGAVSVFYGFQLIEKWLGKAGSATANRG
jgi:hypothetical protein